MSLRWGNQECAATWGLALLELWVLVSFAGCLRTTAVFDISPIDTTGAVFETMVFPIATVAMRPVAVVGVPFRDGRPPNVALAMWGARDAGPAGPIEEGSLAILLRKERESVDFVSGPEYAAGRSPASIAVGDFDKDGIIDVAVVSLNSRPSRRGEGPGELVVFRGLGDGTFSRAWAIPSPRPFPAGIGVADFDGNGYDDIVIGNNTRGTSGISVFFFGAEGVVQSVHLDTVGTGSRSIAIGDFNRDTIPDIAVANLGEEGKPDTAGITVFLGKGHREFERRSFYSHRVPDKGPLALTTGRFTASRFLDLAVLSPQHISILAGDGQGGFTEVNRISAICARGFNFQGIHAADFDRDGNDDLVFVETDSELRSAVIVLLGDGQGGFKKRLEVSKRSLDQVVFDNLNVVDIDQDGYPDIVVPTNTVDFIRAYGANPKAASSREDAKGTLVVFLNRLK